MQQQPLISIIIPTLNEEKCISTLLNNLLGLTGVEIIVSDGGSCDGTTELCRRFPIQVLNSSRGRGCQLNAGAELATGDILLFLHADSLIETRVFNDIRHAICQGHLWGCCTMSFNEETLIFRLIAFFSNLRAQVFSSCYGDQGIYCQRDLFWKIEGFPPTTFLEDIGLSHRLRPHQRAREVKGGIITSTRRFREGGIWKTLVKMQIIKISYMLGIKPERLQKWYQTSREETVCGRP